MPETWRLSKELQEVTKNLARQQEKLKNDEFHVSVVGLEKSGKSTFLNAWLRCDILPNQTTRCTFTTTEIRSATSAQDQRLIIEYMSHEEFEQLRDDYRKQSQGSGREAENARKDLQEIEHDLSRLRAFIGRQPEVISFIDLGEIVEPLRRAVADPTQARAVKKALIYTQSLSGRSGLVFHDVPGYDSPTKLHKDLAKAELARADVIICVTNISSNVSITESLLSMLDVADQEDLTIQAHQKMFVFLNQADRTQSLAEFNDRVSAAVDEWHKRYNKCAPERIIPGSAGVFIKKNLSHFYQPSTKTGVEGAEFRFDAPHGDGIDYIKERVDYYLEHDRAQVVAKRCDALCAKVNTLAQDALKTLSPRYPQSVEDINRDAASNSSTLFYNWFNTVWGRYQRALPDYWQAEVMPTGGDLDKIASENPTLSQLREAYIRKMDDIDASLIKPDDIRDAYLRYTKTNQPSPTQANFGVRDGIVNDAAIQITDELINTLVEALSSVITQVSDWFTAHFFGVESVRPLSIPKSADVYQDKLKYGFETLYMRFARPATRALLLWPRSSSERERSVLEAYKNDIKLLEFFYSRDADPDRRDLRRYLMQGRWGDPPVEQAVELLGEIGQVVPIARKAKSMLDLTGLAELASQQRPQMATTHAEVEQEISEDRDAFIHYLKHSVYYAASFESFCEQELLELKKHLASDATRDKLWATLNQAYHRNDPALLRELQGKSDDTVHQREMVAKLHDLRVAMSD